MLGNFTIEKVRFLKSQQKPVDWWNLLETADYDASNEQTHMCKKVVAIN